MIFPREKYHDKNLPLFSALDRILSLLFAPFRPSQPAETAEGASGTEPPAPEPFKRLEFVFEPDAYYTNVELILALTKAPIPQIGEKTESEIYRMLLSRAAILPQFLVFEASVNPLPYLGVYIKKNEPGFYENAQISGSFNWVQALTAGFEEPYAVSLLAGNVVGFDVAESEEIKGNGYSGYLFSAGNYHIRNNTLIQDRWQEFEWKIKGDRKSPAKKLSWSFRIGGKAPRQPGHHRHPVFSFQKKQAGLQARRRLSLLNNSGFEQTIDLNQRTFSPVGYYFYVDKKWPFSSRQVAFTLALGFIWESEKRYTGAACRETKATTFSSCCGRTSNFRTLSECAGPAV